MQVQRDAWTLYITNTVMLPHNDSLLVSTKYSIGGIYKRHKTPDLEDSMTNIILISILAMTLNSSRLII